MLSGLAYSRYYDMRSWSQTVFSIELPRFNISSTVLFIHSVATHLKASITEPNSRKWPQKTITPISGGVQFKSVKTEWVLGLRGESKRQRIVPIFQTRKRQDQQYPQSNPLNSGVSVFSDKHSQCLANLSKTVRKLIKYRNYGKIRTHLSWWWNRHGILFSQTQCVKMKRCGFFDVSRFTRTGTLLPSLSRAGQNVQHLASWNLQTTIFEKVFIRYRLFPNALCLYMRWKRVLGKNAIRLILVLVCCNFLVDGTTTYSRI